MYLKHIPASIRSGLSKALWDISDTDDVYITFDDGPSENTDFILDELASYEAKATFFLLGERVKVLPGKLKRIVAEGHGIGNHGYAHLDGWKTGYQDYMNNIARGRELLRSSDYRPPYGRMTPRQWRAATKTERVVMWSLMPGDFDPAMDSVKCLERIKAYVEPGSIIVLHDNQKAMDNLLGLLPLLLAFLKEKGLHSKPLPSILK